MGVEIACKHGTLTTVKAYLPGHSRDWYSTAEQPAPAPHHARPEGRTVLTHVCYCKFATFCRQNPSMSHPLALSIPRARALFLLGKSLWRLWKPWHCFQSVIHSRARITIRMGPPLEPFSHPGPGPHRALTAETQPQSTCYSHPSRPLSYYHTAGTRPPSYSSHR